MENVNGISGCSGSQRLFNSLLKQPPRILLRRLIGLSTVFAVGVYLIRSWQLSPENRMDQFQVALQKGDVKSLYALADSAELQRLNLSQEKFMDVIRDAARTPNGFSLGRPREESFNQSQRRYNRAIRVSLLGKDGRPLTSPRDGLANATIVAYNTPTGWKISLSSFIHSVVTTRHEKNAYVDFCMRHDMPTEVFLPSNATWQTFVSSRR